MPEWIADVKGTLRGVLGQFGKDEPQWQGIVSEQGTAVCGVGEDRKQTTYAFVFWRGARHPGTIAKMTTRTTSYVCRLLILNSS
jgi:hypothetical protein